MSVEIVIPWRGGCEHRQEAFDWVRERYRWPVRIGEGGDPWVKADAVMPAVLASPAEIVIVADADCWTDGLFDAVVAVEEGAPWAVPHGGVHRLDADSSARFMGGDQENLTYSQRPYRGYPGGGFVVARRGTLLDVPLDPRFVGWGYEDESWAMALKTLVGQPWRGKSPLIHFWHPPQPRRDRNHGSRESELLCLRYVAANGNPAEMRELIEEGKREFDADDYSRMHSDSAGAYGVV